MCVLAIQVLRNAFFSVHLTRPSPLPRKAIFQIDIVYECIVLRCIVENKLTYNVTNHNTET